MFGSRIIQLGRWLSFTAGSELFEKTRDSGNIAGPYPGLGGGRDFGTLADAAL